MAKHQWSLLCRRSITDKEDNSLSMIDGLEEVALVGPIPKDVVERNISATGTSSFGFQWITLWIRSDQNLPETDFARIRVMNPKGKVLLAKEYSIELNGSSRVRHTVRFASILYDGTGSYRYVTQQRKGTEKKPKWVTVSDLILDVKQADEAPFSE